ncbi:LamG-like jellyroll fold domain-containing protein [Alteromonas sp. M12]|uniref:LamG-like jellyroll fold domain-containing protein n=1 Tax=Alteromonas sp. M12 TaxID=3135644 RepID=UPI00319DA531
MNRTEKYSEIVDIAESIISGSATSKQQNKLENLLSNDPKAQHFYIEYLEFYMQLKSDAVPNFEVVHRKTLIDEVFARPLASAKEQQPHLLDATSQIDKDNRRAQKSYFYFVYGLVLLILLICISTLFFWNQGTTSIGIVKTGELLIDGSGSVSGAHVHPGTYKTIIPTTIELTTEDEIVIGPQSSLKLYNANEVSFRTGHLVVKPNSNTNLTINTQTFDLQSHGGALSLETSRHNAILTADEKVLLSPRKWRPKHYWSFDGESDRALDLAGTAVGLIDKGVQRVSGIIGRGAASFDNGADARVNVGSGGGTAPATGSFSVTDGVSIEALIIPQYTGEGPGSGQYGEIDEIFRKDQSDKDHRMLLSFQHDRDKAVVRPAGEFGASLSFGLYILGQGYHELKLPLDGKGGRPTLQELKNGDFYHVVATYDVDSGQKAIYINGEKLAFFQYPAGSKVLSGGSGLANIGNSPNAIGHAGEAYSGIIDEVAFYDFALSPFIILSHYNNARKGLNYYGMKPSIDALPSTIHIAVPHQHAISIDLATGQPLEILR